jgi:hypothetical protein
MTHPAQPDAELRVELLRQLAELAMSNAEFRAKASVDLERALTEYGYDLNPRERALVLRFRKSLADAGVDLDLVNEIPEEQLTRFLRSGS